jgi:PIF1 helicase.
LIKTLYASVSKTLNFRTLSVEKPKVLLLAPTGVAAVNISGTTIHSGLGIPVEDCMFRNCQIRKDVH